MIKYRINYYMNAVKGGGGEVLGDKLRGIIMFGIRLFKIL